MTDKLISLIRYNRLREPVILIEVTYKAFYNCRGFDIWEVFKDHALSKPICDNYIIRKSITGEKSGNKIY